jgi:hypothetical protein
MVLRLAFQTKPECTTKQKGSENVIATTSFRQGAAPGKGDHADQGTCCPVATDAPVDQSVPRAEWKGGNGEGGKRQTPKHVKASI